MISYIYYTLTVIGISYFITQSDLAEPFRKKIEDTRSKIKLLEWFIEKFEGIITCIYCCSFWTGIIVFVGMYETININTFFHSISVLGLIYLVKNLGKG